MAPALGTLLALADDVLDALVNYWPADAEPLPERRFVAPGEIAWDCCDQLAVRVERTFPIAGDLAVEVIPSDTSGIEATMRAAELAVSITRVVSDLDDQGSAPSPDELAADSMLMLHDAQAMFNALLAAFRADALGTCSGLALLDYQLVGPEGGRAAGVQRVRVSLA